MKNKYNIPLILDYQGEVLIKNYIEHYKSYSYPIKFVIRSINYKKIGICFRLMYEKK
jgi:hypothetical protein